MGGCENDYLTDTKIFSQRVGKPTRWLKIFEAGPNRLRPTIPNAGRPG